MTHDTYEFPAPEPLTAKRMTTQEQIDAWRTLATPSYALIGRIAEVIRTELGECDWLDFWTSPRGKVRMEWKDGPEMGELLHLILPSEDPFQVYGVAGLRLIHASEHHASLEWLAAQGTTLYITRLS